MGLACQFNSIFELQRVIGKIKKQNILYPTFTLTFDLTKCLSRWPTIQLHIALIVLSSTRIRFQIV